MVPTIVMTVGTTAITQLIKTRYFLDNPRKAHIAAMVCAILMIVGWQIINRYVDPYSVEKILGVFSGSIALYEVILKKVYNQQ